MKRPIETIVKSDFIAEPGVQWVNGQRVRGGALVHLSMREAAFDLSLGRIKRVTSKATRRPRETAAVLIEATSEIPEADTEQ